MELFIAPWIWMLASMDDVDKHFCTVLVACFHFDKNEIYKDENLWIIICMLNDKTTENYPARTMAISWIYDKFSYYICSCTSQY